MALGHEVLTLTEQRLTSAEPISDEAFIAIIRHYEGWRVELDDPYTVVLMPPAGFDSSARNAKLIQLVGNWNDSLPVPGTVFDSDGGWRLPDDSLRGPDCAWLSAPRYAELEAVGRAFGDGKIVPEIIIELRSRTDRWKEHIARIERWRDNGALYAIAIDPYEHRVECVKSELAVSSSAFAAEFEAVIAIALKVAGAGREE